MMFRCCEYLRAFSDLAQYRDLARERVREREIEREKRREEAIVYHSKCMLFIGYNYISGSETYSKTKRNECNEFEA